MDVHLPSRGLEGLGREQRIVNLGLLQAEQIRLVLLKPDQHLIQAGAHGIDVPGGDAHGCSSFSEGRLASLQ